MAPESLTTHLIAPDGAKVATAKFEFADGYVTITLETTGQGTTDSRIPWRPHPLGGQV